MARRTNIRGVGVSQPMEIVEYKGWARNLRLANDTVEVIITLDVGPRIISYRRLDGVNVLKNYDAMMGGAAEPEWQIRGGCRFWLGPEDLTRTYFPDNRPVSHQHLAPGEVRCTPPPESEYGVQKEMEVRLALHGSRVQIDLRVTNIAAEPTVLAAWGPTVMAPGGMEIIPLPPKAPHPGHPSNARSPADYAPDQTIAVWPYFDFTDPRWTFGSRYLFLRQDANRGPTKLGFAHRMGWVAYLNAGELFVQRFGYQEGATYPDHGVNYETFSNEDMLEMEPISPVVNLQPGEYSDLRMSWELFGNVPAVTSEADVDRVIVPLVQGQAK